jgi:hypothetical protein
VTRSGLVCAIACLDRRCKLLRWPLVCGSSRYMLGMCLVGGSTQRVLLRMPLVVGSMRRVEAGEAVRPVRYEAAAKRHAMTSVHVLC